MGRARAVVRHLATHRGCSSQQQGGRTNASVRPDRVWRRWHRRSMVRSARRRTCRLLMVVHRSGSHSARRRSSVVLERVGGRRTPSALTCRWQCNSLVRACDSPPQNSGDGNRDWLNRAVRGVAPSASHGALLLDVCLRTKHYFRRLDPKGLGESKKNIQTWICSAVLDIREVPRRDLSCSSKVHLLPPSSSAKGAHGVSERNQLWATVQAIGHAPT